MIKITKITWNPQEISKNPEASYKKFYKNVTGAINKKQGISNRCFYAGFKTFAEVYEKNEKPNELIKLSRNLIEYLVNKEQEGLAGIAYSILIKLNEKNPKTVEELALNGLAIAKRAKDPVHMFARARDLVELYEKTNPGSDIHVKYLRVANKALKDLCQNYFTTANSRFNKISRDLKPLENYELLLCSTKLDIVKYTYKQDPHNAKYELESAKELLNKNKSSEKTETLDILSKKITKYESMLNSY